MTCPGDIELSRAVAAGGGPELAAHLAVCATCREVWDGARAVIELARELPVALPPASRREEVRTAVLAAAAGLAPRRAPRTWLIPAIAVAAAAGVAGTFVMSRPGAPPAHAHGVIRPHAGARYVMRSTAPDEVVQLADGTIDVEVEPLHPGERFRVLTGGAELEVRGTVFTAAARADHLTDVADAHGRVDLRSDGGATATLHAGQAWHAGVAAVDRAPAVTAAPPRLAPPPGSARPDPHPAAAAALPRATEPSVPPPRSRLASPPGSIARSSSREAAAAAPPRATERSAPPPRSRLASPPGSIARSASRDAAAPPRATEPAVPTPPGPALSPPLTAPPAGRAADEVAYDGAWAALRTADFARAATGFARVMLLAPDGPLVEDASFWRAVALARGQRSAEAVSAFRDFLDGHARSSRAGEASAMLGWLLIDARAYDEAARRFDAAIGDADPAVRQSAKAGLDALATRKR
jgi:TolA-binding protein